MYVCMYGYILTRTHLHYNLSNTTLKLNTTKIHYYSSRPYQNKTEQQKTWLPWIVYLDFSSKSKE